MGKLIELRNFNQYLMKKNFIKEFIKIIIINLNLINQNKLMRKKIKNAEK